MNFLEFIPPRNFYFFIFNFLLGLLLAFSFEPFNLPFLSVFVIGIYFFLNDYAFKTVQNYHKIFFFNGVFFGYGFFMLIMYWVSNSILEFDSDLFYVVPIIFMLFPLLLSIFFGVMQLVNAFLWSESNSKIFFFSSIWVIFEFLRSTLFTGLPWNLIGYSWSWSLSFSQTVSILGIYGIGLLTVFSSVCLFTFIFNNKKKLYFLIAFAIISSLYLYGFSRIINHQLVYSDNEIRIIHTYFDQQEKWTRDSIIQTKNLGSLDLVTVFPETSLGFDENKPENWIVGYIRKDQDNFYNSQATKDLFMIKKSLCHLASISHFLN